MTDWHKNCFYRVSLKALIRNDKGEILMVNETTEEGGHFSLPGGGLDYGESTHGCLKREMYEEIDLTSDFDERLIHQQVRWLDGKQAWLMWLTYEIKYDELVFSIGKDADEVRWVNPSEIDTTEPLGGMIRKVLDNE